MNTITKKVAIAICATRSRCVEHLCDLDEASICVPGKCSQFEQETDAANAAIGVIQMEAEVGNAR